MHTRNKAATIAGAGAMMLAGCGEPTGDDTAAMSPAERPATPEMAAQTEEPERATPQSAAAQQQMSNEDGDDDSAAVTIGMTNELDFTPAEAAITEGETVEWINNSYLVHTVTCDPERAVNPEDSVRLPEGAEPFHSGDMATDDVYRRTFDTPGRYVYFCEPHETDGMVATLIVEPREE